MDQPMPAFDERRQWFGEIVTAHYRLLYSVASSIVSDAHRAEDLVQEAVMKAMKALDSLDNDERVVPWLATIVRRHALDARRRGERQPTVALGDSDASLPEPDLRPADQNKEDLMAALGHLDEKYAIVIHLAYFEGLSPADVAIRLKMTRAAVYKRLFRGLKMLREQLERDRAAGGGDKR